MADRDVDFLQGEFELYSLPLDEFELAIRLMRDWRLDRYYAARIRLFDVVLHDVLPDEFRS